MKSESVARIKIWIDELKKIIFTPLQELEFEYFTTLENIGFDAARREVDYKAAPLGLSWGEKWQYGWFRTAIVMPEAAHGKRIFMLPDVGGEMLICVNGVYAGTRDLKHEGIMLTERAIAGESFDILIESYSGHGPRLENGGPIPFKDINRVCESDDVYDDNGELLYSNDKKCDARVGRPCIGIWNEDAYQLLIDVVTLFELYGCLDERSLRAQKLLKGLFEFTRIVDFETDENELCESINKARAYLKPLLECVNGSTAPVFTIFGQSHLDLAWKWHWEETRRKCARTYANQLALLDEYPEYIFMGCEPPILEELEENYPEIFERVKEKVSEGRIVLEGGMYIESDTNLVCGEALVRQCMYGKQYYREKFDVDTKMVWLPDCFGFCGQLPQIFKGCGIDYFATQKIARALKGCEPFPYNIFYWQGIDGTRLLTHFFKKNNARYDVKQLYERWYNDREQNEDIDEMFFPFGFGDGGGGATRDMLETVRRTKDLEGLPRTRMESPIKLFERIEADSDKCKNVYCGEIYLPWHRGTYTAQAQIKGLNRRAQETMRDAELWTSLAFIYGGESQHEKLKALWKKLLFIHFHDVVTGTSIERVNVEARAQLRDIISEAKQLAKTARTKLLALTGAKRGEYAFNSLSWERKCMFDGELLVLLPCGYTRVEAGAFNEDVEYGSVNSDISVSMVNENDLLLENKYLSVTVSGCGEITSLIERESGTEFCAGRMNHFRLLKDINIDYDAWEMASFIDDEEVSKIHISISRYYIDTNGIRVIIEGRVGESQLTQEIILGRHSREITFNTKIDWRECHRLLKVDFPAAIHADESIEETAFGYVKRPVHRSRQYEKDRFEVSQHRFTALSEDTRTFAVLNDSKYGVSTHENVISLSLLRAPKVPDKNADLGIHEFTYELYPSAKPFGDSEAVNAGWELNTKLNVAEYEVNMQSESAEASAPGGWTFASLSSKKVIMDTVKLAEDNSGDLIMRLYQSQSCHEKVVLKVADKFSQVYITDMLEDKKKQLHMGKEQGYITLELDFKPFEIVTLRLCR